MTIQMNQTISLAIRLAMLTLLLVLAFSLSFIYHWQKLDTARRAACERQRTTVVVLAVDANTLTAFNCKGVR
jgi:hypothetical protein